ncbi:hypothetical protein [Chryseosolibacter indicus]|uniref:Uncharacterized protein n=1 Tax=Chryseosolibacter indicus TaxID=2782351 RepID=A0ABS5VQC8_9BACT|nr:hypothetical protein [Chryseosolibacter indicus]MBT1703659.1 hypothetical protein [Chryseosolibacter indicus]
MEQTLINELIKLMCRSGGEHFVGNFQKEINEEGEAEAWTKKEIEEAVNHIRYMNDYFGKEEAIAVITNLIARYNVDVKEVSLRENTAHQKIGM